MWYRNAQTYIDCPFCGEHDFDLIGLKMHLQRGWCEAELQAGPGELKCPFCDEEDFDQIGLWGHLFYMDCDNFNQI
jgi:hypothetical protein